MRIYIGDFTIYTDEYGKGPFVRCFATWDGSTRLETNILALRGPIEEVLGEGTVLEEVRTDGGQIVATPFERGDFLPLARAILEAIPEQD